MNMMILKNNLNSNMIILKWNDRTIKKKWAVKFKFQYDNT